MTNKTKVINNYLIKDIQKNITIPKNLKFLPLYISQAVLNIINKCIQKEENLFRYRCDLHNFTKKDLLSDFQDNVFKYPTVHTPQKTRFAKIKQDIFDKWLIIVPLSTYYIPYILTHVNTTQSVGYFCFETKKQAEDYLVKIKQDCFKVIIHLTRYGNFNNIMVLKHLKFDTKIELSKHEINTINNLIKKIKY